LHDFHVQPASESLLLLALVFHTVLCWQADRQGWWWGGEVEVEVAHPPPGATRTQGPQVQGKVPRCCSNITLYADEPRATDRNFGPVISRLGGPGLLRRLVDELLGLGERQPLGGGARTRQHAMEKLSLTHLRDLAMGQQLAVRPEDGKVDAGEGEDVGRQVKVQALAPDWTGALAADVRLLLFEAPALADDVHL
jgi:hypothetical protein